MRFYHYSSSSFVLDASRRYEQRDHFKPKGLWLSAESGHEDGWKDWCESESFALESLAHRTQIFLHPDANVLRIKDASALEEFSRRYYRHVDHSLREIDWSTVASLYAGIIIAPYIYEKRLDHDVFWYYSWDCASACIWDLSVVEQQITLEAT